MKKAAGKKKSKKMPGWKSTNVRAFANTSDREFDAHQIEQFGDKDWEVLLDYEEEMERLGHFTCIFPTSETLLNYQRFFTTPRYYNTLCGRWLQYKKKHRVSYMPSKENASIASCWKSTLPRPSPIKKVASASKLLGHFGSKQKVGFLV